jgi:nucleotide-binding universal stress UspA family protein
MMFRHILVSTDGSKLASRGVIVATRLAKSLKARMSAVYVYPPYVPPTYGEAAIYIPEITPRRYKELCEKDARKVLDKVEAKAKSAGVPCASAAVMDDRVWQAILRTAKSNGCDAIVMSSHGRSEFAGLLLGSETTKVLAHSKIPVLVCR